MLLDCKALVNVDRDSRNKAPEVLPGTIGQFASLNRVENARIV